MLFRTTAPVLYIDLHSFEKYTWNIYNKLNIFNTKHSNNIRWSWL